MIREIFVPLMQSPADRAALDSAIALANACHAHVSAMVALEHPVPVVTEFGYLPVEWGQRELELARGSAEAAAAAARARLQRETESSEVRLTEVFLLWSEEAAALQARQADISVMAHPGPDESSPRFNLNFKSLLLNSGRPLLVVPQGAGLAPPVTRAVIAWKPTAEAARAAHDALALLAPACEVDLVMVDPQPREGGHGEEPGADMARHLARHGLRVRVLALPCEGNSEGATLLRHVRESGAGRCHPQRTRGHASPGAVLALSRVNITAGVAAVSRSTQADRMHRRGCNTHAPPLRARCSALALSCSVRIRRWQRRSRSHRPALPAA